MLCRTTFFGCCTRFADKVYVVHVYFCILLDYSAIIPPENKFYKSRFSSTIATIVRRERKVCLHLRNRFGLDQSLRLSLEQRRTY